MAYQQPQFPPGDFPSRSRRLSPRVYQPDQTPSRRDLLYIEQIGLCYWCKEMIPKGLETLEHLIPRSAYDHPLRSHPANFVVACHKCNQKRGNMDLFRWATKMRTPIPRELARLLKELE